MVPECTFTRRLFLDSIEFTFMIMKSLYPFVLRKGMTRTQSDLRHPLSLWDLVYQSARTYLRMETLGVPCRLYSGKSGTEPPEVPRWKETCIVCNAYLRVLCPRCVGRRKTLELLRYRPDLHTPPLPSYQSWKSGPNHRQDYVSVSHRRRKPSFRLFRLVRI